MDFSKIVIFIRSSLEMGSGIGYNRFIPLHFIPLFAAWFGVVCRVSYLFALVGG